MIKTVLCFVFILANTCCSLLAQKLEPVKWSFDITKLNETEYLLFFDARIDEGWHLNSATQQITDEFLLPTHIELTPVAGVSYCGFINEIGEVETLYQSDFKKSINAYANRVTYNTIVIKKNKSQFTTLSGYVRFTACDDRQCLSPQKVPFEFTLN